MATSIARWLFNEAASGTTPATVADDSGNGGQLTVNFNSAGNWTSIGAGRGLQSTATAGAGSALSATITDVFTNSGLSALNGATQCSLIIVCDITAGLDGGRLFHMGRTPNAGAFIYGGGELAVEVRANGTVYVRFDNDTDAGIDQFSGDITGSLAVLHVVIDTTEAAQADRCKLWINGSEATQVYSEMVENDAILVNTDTHLSILDKIPVGDDPVGNIQGSVYYCEVFSDKLTTQEISDSYTALLANNDADWSGAAMSFSTTPNITARTDDGGTINFVVTGNTSPATVDVLMLSDNTLTQPSEAAFDAATIGGTASVDTAYNQVITGFAAATDYDVWLRVSDGTTSLYSRLDLRTTPDAGSILVVDGDNVIRYGDTGIVVNLSGGGANATGVLVNGVAQSNVVAAETQVTFDFDVWPSARVGDAVVLTVQDPDGDITTNVTHTYLQGWGVVNAESGYTETANNISTTPDLPDGSQFLFQLLDEGGTDTVNEDDVLFESDGTYRVNAEVPGSVRLRVVSGSDGSLSPEVLITSTTVDVVPDQPTLTNQTEQEPASYTVQSFVLSGVGASVVWSADNENTTVSTGSGNYGNTTTANDGETVNVRVLNGSFGVQRVGSATSNGITASFNSTVRAAIAPVITTQPTAQAVVSGNNFSFSVIANTGGLADPMTYQWYESDGSLVAGATSSVYSAAAVIADSGKQFYCIVTSSEGATVQSNTVLLTVSLENTRVVSDVLLNFDGTTRANEDNIQVVVRNATTRAELVSTTVSTDSNGQFTIDGSNFGNVGDTVIYELPNGDSPQTYCSFDKVLVAAS